MAETPKNPIVLDSFDKKHLQQVAALENKVAAIYAELCKEVGVVAELYGKNVDLEKVFKLGDYPQLNKKVDEIIGSLHDRLGSAIVDGVTAQWQLANEKNDDLVRRVFGKDLDGLTEDQLTRYFTSNDNALKAFLNRKDKGLGLSQKVWKYAKEAKVDIESTLELGIKTGQSASSLARDLKQHLKEPDRLFRRVRDKEGKLHLSKAAQAYHPGQGVYRSSYKNALRLAVTEANMAYRASDYERVQNFDFVVGIEVRLSNNHTLNGKPFFDICDELKGKYPKDFKFRGWHPFCYSKDSEVLTAQGWKRFEDVTFEDKVVSLNPNTREVEYVSISATQKYWYAGPMYRFFNKTLDCLVTPDHQMVYLNKRDGEIRFCDAKDFSADEGAFCGVLENVSNISDCRVLETSTVFDKEIVPYSDYVYDLTLERNHIMYIKRNGKCFWGSNCRCHSITILKTREELMEDNRRILAGEEPTEESVNSVTEMPSNFQKWVDNNKARILAADKRGTLPYFITDNPYTVNTALGQPLASVKVPLWYAHNAQVKEVQGKLKEIKAWSAEHPKSKKFVGQINSVESAIANGASIEDILAQFNVLDHDYKFRVSHDAYLARKKAEAAKKPTALEIAKKRHESRTAEQISNIKTEWGKRTIRQLNQAIDDGLLPQEVFGKTGDMYMMLKVGDFTAFNKAVSPLQKAVARHKARTTEIKKAIQDTWNLRKETILKAEQALSDLIPNVHELHKSYSLKELQKVHGELNDVMSRWLSKYGYSSIDTAKLEHLKNKLTWELTHPSVSYSNSEILKKAIDENIRIIDRKIEWNGLVAKANSLKSFNTKSKVFKGCIADIDDAINSNDFKALQKSIEEAEKQQLRITNDRLKASGSTEGALNKEYKGGAVGADITGSFDARNMESADPFNKRQFTQNAAQMQGFDAPAKLVSEQEFAALEKACGEVFYRTVNPTTIDGIDLSAEEFASYMYRAESMAMNGGGGRIYGDGIYVATSAWDGRTINALSQSGKDNAFMESAMYGDGKHITLEMTWTRKPKLITRRDLEDLWNKLTDDEKLKFGSHYYGRNAYGCALGFDGMYCNGPNYMVIWNRSIIAVKKK